MAFKKLKLWFDGDLAQLLADKIVEVQADFPSKSFIRQVEDGVEDLELKDRVALMAELLGEGLGEDYPANIKILEAILGPENTEETGMFTNFYWIMPIAKYVEDYGLDHFGVSIKMIGEITKRNTGEYTIRPYLIRHQKRTLAKMSKWSKAKNFHLRRLASEGGRPRLPWAPKLQPFIDDPSPLWPILNQLIDDPSKYVQKSVANCLNDILKDNRELAQKWIDTWQTSAETKARKWIIKHALRNLIKQEDPWALQCLNQLNP